MERLLNLIHKELEVLDEDLQDFIVRGDVLAADIIKEVRELLNGDWFQTVTIRHEDRVMARLEPDGSIEFTEDFDRVIESFNTIVATQAREFKEGVNHAPALGRAPDDSLASLGRLFERYSTPLVFRCHVRKDRIINKAIHQVPGLKLWFNALHFDRWLHSLDLKKLVEFFGGESPLIIASGTALPIHTIYHAGSIPIVDLFKENAPTWLAEHEEYKTKVRARRTQLDANSTAPIILPDLFGFPVDARSDIQTKPLMRVVLYSLLSVQASSARFINGSEFSLSFGSNRRVSGNFTIDDDSVWADGGEAQPLTPTLFSALHKWYQEKQSTLSESAVYPQLWETALETALDSSPINLVRKAGTIPDRFRDLRDKLLNTNLEKVLTSIEKGQTALNQVTGQIGKDLDGLAADSEKAILGGLTGGVIAILGAITKSGPLDVVVPFVGLFALAIYVPYLLRRLESLQDSITRKESDFRLTLDLFKRAAGDVFRIDPFLASFGETKAAADRQLLSARNWINNLAVGIHLMVVVTMVIGFLKSGTLWIAPVAWICGVLIMREQRLREEKLTRSFVELGVAAVVLVGLIAAAIRVFPQSPIIHWLLHSPVGSLLRQ